MYFASKGFCPVDSILNTVEVKKYHDSVDIHIGGAYLHLHHEDAQRLYDELGRALDDEKAPAVEAEARV